MREAANSAEILKKIKKDIGLKIKIIDGKEEAEIIRNTNRVILPTIKPYTLFMDVGGGSTELSIEKGGVLLKQKSFKVGTLRILGGKVKPNVWNNIEHWLSEYKSDFHKFHIVGTGGNINRLCKLFGNNEIKELNIENLEFGYQQLKSMDMNDRILQYGFRPDRADVIVPAASIYLFVMNNMDAKTIFVPRKGLSDGLILKQYREWKTKQ